MAEVRTLTDGGCSLEYAVYIVRKAQKTPKDLTLDEVMVFQAAALRLAEEYLREHCTND